MIPCGPKVDITFQTKTESKDSMGAFSETWSDYATVPAVFTDKGDKWIFRDGKKTQFGTHVCYIDYNANLESFSVRVKYNNQYYEVIGIHNPLSQNIMLKFDLQLVNV